MDDLILVTKTMINEEEVNSVNLRDVWAFLECKREFSNWAKDRLSDFEKGNDYMVDKIVTQYNQVDRIEYIVTIDTAKHIAMLERNKKGKDLRQYFIDMEREFRLEQHEKILAAKDILELSEVAMKAAIAFGFEGNQAKLSADKIIKKVTGKSVLLMLDQSSIESDEQELFFTATEIGQQIEPKISAIKINRMLAAADLIEQKIVSRKGKSDKKWWELTDQGKEFGKYFDTGKKHSDGTPVQQIKWKKKIIKLLD